MKPQGTAQGPSAPSAQPEATSRGTGTEALLEQMLERHNMLAALRRVEANGGAPGVDGMETKDLRPYLRDNWERIRLELLAGTYEPMPVRRVEIPKPDGGGTPPLLGMELWVPPGPSCPGRGPGGPEVYPGRVHLGGGHGSGPVLRPGEP